MAGSGLYWGAGERQLLELAERHRVPVFLNGLGRGCVPADHELFFSRARSAGLGQADVALVIGVPLDFRLAFGAAFDPECEVIAIDVAEPEREHPRAGQRRPVRCAAGDARRAQPARPRPLVRPDARRGSLRCARSRTPSAPRRRPTAPTSARRFTRCGSTPSSPRCSTATRSSSATAATSSPTRAAWSTPTGPGCWLDPGPFGCLGAGPGQALAAKLAHPERQVVLLLGDGAFGFAGMEFDTLARHGVAVVGVIGNNGIWALEKHPMEAIYGYSVAADLRPGTRYDELAEALGCHGELVREPAQLRPALERAFGAGGPALVNVLTDPNVAYPRAREARLSQNENRPHKAGGFRSRFGPIGTGRGTYQKGPVLRGSDGGRRRCLRLRPSLCWVKDRLRGPSPANIMIASQLCQQSNICPAMRRFS